MIYTKCKICGKVSPFEVCCNYNKETGEKVNTIFDLIKKILKQNK